MQNRDNHELDRLVAELFHEDWAAGPLAAAARESARRVRRQRRVRAGALGAVALAAITAVFWGSRPAPDGHSTREFAAAPEAAAASPCEIISDAQLEAALRGHRVLLTRDARGFNAVEFLER
ncbi:MAG TPA: hypothetical protein VK163_16400 [Opitutaceae bacterium]|nr:hypothetical protein [Opitutaceae bacterium]